MSTMFNIHSFKLNYEFLIFIELILHYISLILFIQPCSNLHPASMSIWPTLHSNLNSNLFITGWAMHQLHYQLDWTISHMDSPYNLEINSNYLQILPLHSNTKSNGLFMSNRPNRSSHKTISKSNWHKFKPSMQQVIQHNILYCTLKQQFRFLHIHTKAIL
jgi:hypothetical protein